MKPRKCKFKPMVTNKNGELERKKGKFRDGIRFDVMKSSEYTDIYIVEDMRGFVYYVHFADIRYTDTAQYYADKLGESPGYKNVIFEMDGNKIHCHGLDYINGMESPEGYGSTKKEAYSDYIKDVHYRKEKKAVRSQYNRERINGC